MTDHKQHDPMQQLRKLLFKEEEARISAMEEVRDNEALHAKEIAKVLVEALDLRAHDEKLGKALMPAVETAVNESIAKDPKAFADALFPIMGPAIRRSIQYAISDMLQSLNQTLEHAFSPKSLTWRWQAFRTGKSFAEVVMLNTLLYRVEQVFWIHKETGLLLAHESFDPKLTEDADMVSSMLTAVGDFIQDSFAGDEQQAIQSLRLGDLEVMIEQGPYTVLAIVCRGNPPRSLRVTLSQTLEDLRQTFYETLKNFDGDTSPLAASHEILSPLLLVDYIEQEKKSPMKLIIALSFIAISVVSWEVWAFKQNLELKHRWQAYIQSLKETPGFVITSVDERNSLHHIYGLRDPLSIPAESQLKAFQLKQEDVRYHFKFYHALDHDILLQRLWHLAQAPSSISFQIKDGTLYVHGKASQVWLSQLKDMTRWIEGIVSVNTDDMRIAKTLKERLIAELHPPTDVAIHIQGTKVRLTGFSTQAWLTQSKKRMQSFKSVTSYDDSSVVTLDSPAYLLTQAQQHLQAPNTVHLSIEKNNILKIDGYAPASWLTQARIKVKDLAYITALDTQSFKTLKQMILTRAKLALNPPKSVHLSFKNGRLFATGKANKHWTTLATSKALNIKGVHTFQHQVQRIWHDDEILKHAISVLHPESGVQLSFKETVLQASGEASQAWITFAHQKALHIDGVLTFDSRVQAIYSDESILKSAKQVLHPPLNIRLQVSKGILSLSGEAKPLWIKDVQTKTRFIQGLRGLYLKELKAIHYDNDWKTLQARVASLRLTSPANQPILSSEDIKQLKALSQLYHHALSIHPNTMIHIQMTYGRAERLVAKMRNLAIYQKIKRYDVPKSKIHTNFNANSKLTQDSSIQFSLISKSTGP